MTGVKGGMHVMWHLPANYPSAAEVEERARRYGVGVYALRSGAAHFIGDSPYAERGLILGYTRLQPFRSPGRAARLLPDQSTTLWMDSSSTGDSRLRGALPIPDFAEGAQTPL